MVEGFKKFQKVLETKNYQKILESKDILEMYAELGDL